MPFYDLRCKCGKEFNVMARMSDREHKLIECPECGNNELEAIFSSVNFMMKSKSREMECPNAHVCGSKCKH